jgi:hypothetical protein
MEVGQDTKLLPDSDFLNCTRAYKPKSENTIFSWPPMAQGCSHRVPSMPRNHEKDQNYPKPVKWATLFRGTLVILLLQVKGKI